MCLMYLSCNILMHYFNHRDLCLYRVTPVTSSHLSAATPSAHKKTHTSIFIYDFFSKLSLINFKSHHNIQLQMKVLLPLFLFYVSQFSGCGQSVSLSLSRSNHFHSKSISQKFVFFIYFLCHFPFHILHSRRTTILCCLCMRMYVLLLTATFSISSGVL